MAIDEAILAAQRAGQAPPTIRFYGWQPAAVSLGYFQRAAAEIDLERCRANGIDVVRRLTGGRAVLHERELTYSIVVSEDYPLLPPTITASYLLFSSGLAAGLRRLGVRAAMTMPQAAYAKMQKQRSSAACFDAPAHYELTFDGRKLAGSAQVRKDGVVLQHGSILLDFAPRRLAELLRIDDAQREAVAAVLDARATSLRRILGREVGWQETAEAVEAGLREVLQAELEEGELTAGESAAGRRLIEEKYGSMDWTLLR